MDIPVNTTRRKFLVGTATATAAATLATVLPARVLGREGAVPPKRARSVHPPRLGVLEEAVSVHLRRSAAPATITRHAIGGPHAPSAPHGGPSHSRGTHLLVPARPVLTPHQETWRRGLAAEKP